jgi:hypothetical protein
MNKSWTAVSALLIAFVVLPGCGGGSTPAESHSPDEPEPIARTEFTDRIENFFEYEPLRSAKPSQFRIHLTDLSDGSPVEKAEVSLTVRRAGAADSVLQTTAKVGKVTGIYVADVSVPQAGNYDIEFHVKNNRLDERLPLTGFEVE